MRDVSSTVVIRLFKINIKFKKQTHGVLELTGRITIANTT